MNIPSYLGIQVGGNCKKKIMIEKNKKTLVRWMENVFLLLIGSLSLNLC